MPNITSLPLELIGCIAQFLDLESVCSLRLAHPMFPGATVRRLKQVHRWNAMAFSSALTASHLEIDYELEDSGGPDNEEETSDELHERPYAWCATLCHLASHPLYSTWITSVCIMHRIDMGMLRWRYKGLGTALNSFTNLNTLWLLDGEHKALRAFIKEFCAPRSHPALRYLTISSSLIQRKVLLKLIDRFHDSLRGLNLERIVLLDGSMSKDVLPALAKCDLIDFKLVSPCEFIKPPKPRARRKMLGVGVSHAFGQKKGPEGCSLRAISNNMEDFMFEGSRGWEHAIEWLRTQTPIRDPM